MKKILMVIVALSVAATLRAQSFETQVEDSLRPFVAEDAFADIGACGVLNIKTIHTSNLHEVPALVKPCMDAVAKKYATKVVIEPGLLSAPHGKAGLLVKTDIAAGSKGHRDLVAGLSRRQGHLFGHPTKILTLDEVTPTAISTIQKAIDSCMLLTVVRDLNNGEDFVNIYGKCLTKNAELKITEIRPAEGLTVTVKADATGAQVEAYNGFVTVNAGKGPVSVMIIAYGKQVYRP